MEAPSSTGLGLYSGSVNPGQPNLRQIEELNRQNLAPGVNNTAHVTLPFPGGSAHRCSVNTALFAAAPLRSVLLAMLFSCDSSPVLILSESPSAQGLQNTYGRLGCFCHVAPEASSCPSSDPCTLPPPHKLGSNLEGIVCHLMQPLQIRRALSASVPGHAQIYLWRLKVNPIISLNLRKSFI